MEGVITLRGAVASKYKSISNFARAIGWTRNKASRIINNEQDITLSEIIEVTNALEIDSQEVFLDIFFAPLSTKWKTKTIKNN